MSHDPPSVEEISHLVYHDFAAQMHEKYVVPNQVCQVCKKNPSVRINRWGPIKACCQSCLDEEYQRFLDACREDEEYRQKYGDD